MRPCRRWLAPAKFAPIIAVYPGEGGGNVKRIKAACIFQTLVFSQKEDCGLSREQCLNLNRQELSRYRQSPDRTGTRYQIDSQQEQPDGSILLQVRKQYNDRAEVAEYFR